MTTAKLMISGPDGNRQVRLNPGGTLLGRDASCDIVLDDKGVSRLHARLYQDPFGRWIIEDLNSHNGVMIGDQRIKAHALRQGQTINIARFSLSLLDEMKPTTSTGVLIEDLITVVDKGASENIINHKSVQSSILSSDLMRKLNELTRSLMEVSNPSDLYTKTCLHLSSLLDGLVVVARLTLGPDQSSMSPSILACQFKADTEAEDGMQTNGLYLSQRVLKAVYSTETPVMATSSATDPMKLTIVDEGRPHIVFAARLNNVADSIDALYLDLLEESCPEKMFDFVEAAARQVTLIQKKLFFEELQKTEESLRKANIQLKEKDRIKDEYVSRVTHDIKGHLSAIKICLDLACHGLNSLNDQQAEFLNRAYQRTTRLSNFVVELLSLTKMRLSGRSQTKPFSLSKTISEAIETVSRKAQDKSITLTSAVETSDGEIEGDEFSINEMITNLLFNAIKYTPQNKSVHIETKEVNGAFHINISDEGIGIPEDEIESVFDEFFRASNAKTYEKDGTGLGLSIVTQIIKRHGGHISVQSQVGHGTTFKVILPKKGSM